MNRFVDNHFKSIIIIMLAVVLIITGGFKVIEIVSPKTAGVSEVLLEKTFGTMIDKRLAPVISKLDQIEKNQPQIQENPMVLLLEFHLNRWVKAEDCSSTIKMWEDQEWGAQITAIKYVARHHEAMEYLKKVTIQEDVYKAFAMKVAKY